jgi:transposase
MIGVAVRRMFLARAVVDMRRSYDTLISMVEGQLGMDPLSGDAFVFVGKKHQRLKILVFDRGGYWLMCRRLEQGSFAMPVPHLSKNSQDRFELDGVAWNMLLEGVKALEVRRSKRWEPPSSA